MGSTIKTNQQNDNPIQQSVPILQSELLATVSHELRGPLAAIKGYARTLLRHEQRLDQEERQEFLRAIDKASDRLALTLDRFFELAQLETGAVSLVSTTVHILDLIQDVMIAARQRGQYMVSKGEDENGQEPPFQFTFALPQQWYHNEVGLHVWGDQQRLREVFDQLLDNAMLYSPRGGTIEVTLALQPLSVVPYDQYREASTNDETTEGYVIAVRDRGIGIEREHLHAIFQRFYRVDTRLVREVNGLGLGLTICKYLVELHNGYIWAESDVGQGSTFMVWLPAVNVVKDENTCPHAKQES